MWPTTSSGRELKFQVWSPYHGWEGDVGHPLQGAFLVPRWLSGTCVVITYSQSYLLPCHMPPVRKPKKYLANFYTMIFLLFPLTFWIHRTRKTTYHNGSKKWFIQSCILAIKDTRGYVTEAHDSPWFCSQRLETFPKIFSFISASKFDYRLRFFNSFIFLTCLIFLGLSVL